VETRVACALAVSAEERPAGVRNQRRAHPRACCSRKSCGCTRPSQPRTRRARPLVLWPRRRGGPVRSWTPRGAEWTQRQHPLA
jgi:hypothetical protein